MFRCLKIILSPAHLCVIFLTGLVFIYLKTAFRCYFPNDDAPGLIDHPCAILESSFSILLEVYSKLTYVHIDLFGFNLDLLSEHSMLLLESRCFARFIAIGEG